MIHLFMYNLKRVLDALNIPKTDMYDFPEELNILNERLTVSMREDNIVANLFGVVISANMGDKIIDRKIAELNNKYNYEYQYY